MTLLAIVVLALIVAVSLLIAPSDDELTLSKRELEQINRRAAARRRKAER